MGFELQIYDLQPEAKHRRRVDTWTRMNPKTLTAQFTVINRLEKEVSWGTEMETGTVSDKLCLTHSV